MYLFRPSARNLEHMKRIVSTSGVESDINENFNTMPPHLILIKEFQGDGLHAFNHNKINADATAHVLGNFMLKKCSPGPGLVAACKATWQRITQILDDLDFLAVKVANVSGRSILSGNSDFYFSSMAFNENGYRSCPGGCGPYKQD